MTELFNKLKEICGSRVLENEPMSEHTSFKVGGPASLYAAVANADELAQVLRACNEAGTEYYIIGNGSNLLVRDEGYDGVIIELGRNFSEISVDGNVVTAQAGASMAAVAAAARDAGLTGFEFASGIPGTLGGGCVMNAGAYDGEIKNVLKSVKLMNKKGEIIEEEAEKLRLDYRYSNIPERNLIVIEATLAFTPGDRNEITAKMKELNARRAAKQPLEYPSAGSTFKRPKGYFAGKLIQEAGMQGYTVGGAQVSEKHAGFVINKGGATARDIWQLTCDVREAVAMRAGVWLEREIKLL